MKFKKTLSLLPLFFILIACEAIIEVPDISDQQVTVLAPLEGTILNDNQVNFNWSALEDTDDYRVQVASPTFENAAQFYLDSLVSKDTLNQLDNHVNLALLNGNYQWRIKATNSAYETTFTTNGFIIDGDPNADLVAPNTPTLVNPSDETAQDETAVSFTWEREAISGSTEIDSIYIYTDESLLTLNQKGLGANKSFVTTLEANDYYWLVKAFDTAGNESENSTVFKLTIN